MIVRASPDRPVSAAFVGLYTLAQIGAFIAFVPMLNLLLPLKAQALDPAGKAVLLSQVAVLGALAAAVSNLVIGGLSDATRSRWGRRRPWILAGALAASIAHFAVIAAPDAPSLILAVVLFQVAVNLMFGPLNALLPDVVADERKGLVSAWQGLALPIAGLFSGLFLALTLDGLEVRATVTALVIPLCFAPLVLLLRDDPPAPTARSAGFDLSALRDRDFRLAFLSRLLVQAAITLNVLYLLFYLQDEARLPSGPLGEPDAALGTLLSAGTLSALVVGFLGGLVSDRLNRRKGLVGAGGLLMAAGALGLALAPTWPGPLLAQILLGAGLGLYSTVDIALVAQVLPDRSRAGRDLGVMNLAITLPQIAAPLLGAAVLHQSGAGLRAVFAVACVLAAAGGLVVMTVRGVR